MINVRINNIRRLVLTGFLFTIGSSVVPQEKIEGLLYLDHSPVSIEITDGRISDIKRLKNVTEDFPKVFIAPGFIDNQVNGFAGVTFALGNGNLTLEGVIRATKTLWEAGITTYLPTLTTNSKDLLVKNLLILARAKEVPELYGSIAGFHLEGPYISSQDGYRGAHPKGHVRDPDWKEFLDLYQASGGNILQVTLAPETEGALEFITNCKNAGIRVGLGHHNSSMDLITEAIDRGALIATHLGNGIAGNIDRHNNPLWPQLSDDRLMISIICDGFHLPPELIRVFYKAKGPEMTILTSDVTSFGGLPPGNYSTGDGEPIEITEEGKLWNIARKSLYGSASSLTTGVGHVMKVTGCSLGDAIQMASTNPARLYGLDDRGKIQMGMRADLIIFSLEDYKITIHKTIVSGNVVYSN
jgi:N-acetylglucosamine-6-phosphate deacetylase